MNQYIPWRDMTEKEKSEELWIRKGRPRLIWDSSKLGVFEHSNLDSVAILQENERNWSEILKYGEYAA